MFEHIQVSDSVLKVLMNILINKWRIGRFYGENGVPMQIRKMDSITILSTYLQSHANAFVQDGSFRNENSGREPHPMVVL